MTLQVTTANLNGVRAALKRGGLTALARSDADVVCAQEVRANDEQTAQALREAGMARWHYALAADVVQPGRSGVAILSRRPLRDVATSLGPTQFTDRGRWLEATVSDPASGADIRVASAYVPKGAAQGPAQAEKDIYLSALGAWLAAHRSTPALLCADLNVAHTQQDLRNWRGNRGRPGFLASERAHLDRWYAPPPDGLGWTDLGRRFGGPGPGPYTWWSWRGRAFDADAGWRIDVVLASPPMAERASGCYVARAASYAERPSDHAPVSATFR